MNADFKTCRHCETEKPADLEHFHRHNRKSDGLQVWCKECMRSVMKQHQREHPAENQERVKAYYDDPNNKEQIKSTQAQAQPDGLRKAQARSDQIRKQAQAAT